MDDEWWREQPVSRAYYELAPEEGRTVTVYTDLRHNRWYHQQHA